MSRLFWIVMVVVALVAGTLFQARDFVFDLQLTPLQFRNLQTIARRVCEGFGNLVFEGPMPSLKWIKAEGGLQAMAERNEAKARLLYDYIDASDFFRGTAQPAELVSARCFDTAGAPLEGDVVRLSE